MIDDRAAVPPQQEHQPPVSVSRSPEVDGGLRSLDDPKVLQILSTEHWSLLSARSLVYNEAFARAGMFLTFVSASLVALALAANAMKFSSDFLLLAAALLTLDLIMGLATVGRLLDATLDDLRAIHGMNRIRNGYGQIAPEVLPFLTTSIHDDAAGVMATYGVTAHSQSLVAGVVHGLSTTNGMISALNATVAGAITGLLVMVAGAGPVAAVVATAIAVVAVFVALSRHAFRTIRRFETGLESRFPTPRQGSEG